MRDPESGWLFFDGECPVCIRTVECFSGFLRRRGFQPLPLQTPGTGKRLGVPGNRLFDEMRVLTRQGAVYGGADAVVFLAKRSWWARPIAWLGAVKAGRALLDKIYKTIAARRSCRGACAQP